MYFSRLRDVFFAVANRFFFFSQVSFYPVKQGNRVGFSRNRPGYSGRGTQIRFPLFGCHGCENFGAIFFNKKGSSNRALIFIICQFSDHTIEMGKYEPLDPENKMKRFDFTGCWHCNFSFLLRVFGMMSLTYITTVLYYTGVAHGYCGSRIR